MTELGSFFNRALGEDSRPSGLSAHQQSQSVHGSVTGHTNRSLNFAESTESRLSGVGGQQRRRVFKVGHVSLVGRGAAGPQFLHGHHQFHHIKLFQDVQDFRPGSCRPIDEQSCCAER